jgi:hypothetical protein
VDSSLLVIIGCAIAIGGLLNQLRMRRSESRRLLGAAASIRAHGREMKGSLVRGQESGALRLFNAAIMTAGLGLAIVGALNR